MSKPINAISGTTNIFIHIFFIVVSVVCIYPLLLVLGVSLTDEKALLSSGYRVIPQVFSFYSYEYVFKSAGAIVHSYGLTIMVTVVGTVLGTLVTVLYAYPLSRKEFQYRNFFSFFIFFTMIFNGGLVPWYIVCVKLLHINDTVWALILPYLVNVFFVIVMRTFFTTTIPNEIIESAKLDGLGEFKTLFLIVLPLSLPGLATIGLFMTLLYWNDWWLPLILVNHENLYNLQFIMYKIMSNITYLDQISSTISGAAQAKQRIPSEGARMAMSIISIGPIILAYPFFQKYFIQGLTIGAVKG